MATPLNDLVAVFRRIFRFLKLIGIVLFLLTIYVVGREVLAFHETVHEVHPALGYLYLGLVAVLAAWLIGLPVYRFFRMPTALRAPDVPSSDEEWTMAHVRAQVTYLERYLKSLRRNPRLSESGEAIRGAEAELRQVRGRVAGLEDPVAARAEVARFEKGRIDALLDPIDREADRLIRNEALAVGVATAISPNGTLDAFIVLWRNANLVSRIANLYYGRPGVRGSLTILRDVSAAALLATYLEGLSEAAGALLRGILGSVAGVVAGPVVDGGVNAIATLRIGYLAKARCRSFRAWTDATRRQALADALSTAKDRSREVIAGVAKAAGGTMSELTGKVGDAVKGGLNAILKKLRGEPESGPAGA